MFKKEKRVVCTIIKHLNYNTSIATFLFHSCHKPSIHGVCQFLDLLMMKLHWSCNHSFPNVFQKGMLSPLTVNFTFEKGPLVIGIWVGYWDLSQVRKDKVIIWSFNNQAVDACDGALSCIKIMDFLNAAEIPSVPPLEESILQNLAIHLGVDLRSIFHPKRSN